MCEVIPLDNKSPTSKQTKNNSHNLQIASWDLHESKKEAHTVHIK